MSTYFCAMISSRAFSSAICFLSRVTCFFLMVLAKRGFGTLSVSAMNARQARERRSVKLLTLFDSGGDGLPFGLGLLVGLHLAFSFA